MRGGKVPRKIPFRLGRLTVIYKSMTRINANNQNDELQLQLINGSNLNNRRRADSKNNILRDKTNRLSQINRANNRRIFMNINNNIRTFTVERKTSNISSRIAKRTNILNSLLSQNLSNTRRSNNANDLFTNRKNSNLNLLNLNDDLGRNRTATKRRTFLSNNLNIARNVFSTILTLLNLSLNNDTSLSSDRTTDRLNRALLRLLAIMVKINILSLDTSLNRTDISIFLKTDTLGSNNLILKSSSLLNITRRKNISKLRLRTRFIKSGLDANRSNRVLRRNLTAITGTQNLSNTKLRNTASIIRSRDQRYFTISILDSSRRQLTNLRSRLNRIRSILLKKSLTKNRRGMQVFRRYNLIIDINSRMQNSMTLIRARTLNRIRIRTRTIIIFGNRGTILTSLIRDLDSLLTSLEIDNKSNNNDDGLILNLSILNNVSRFLSSSLNNLLSTTARNSQIKTNSRILRALIGRKLDGRNYDNNTIANSIINLLNSFLSRLNTSTLMQIFGISFLNSKRTVINSNQDTMNLIRRSITTLQTRNSLSNINRLIRTLRRTLANFLVVESSLYRNYMFLRVTECANCRSRTSDHSSRPSTTSCRSQPPDTGPSVDAHTHQIPAPSTTVTL